MKNILHEALLHDRHSPAAEVLKDFEQELSEHPNDLGIVGNGYFTINRPFAATVSQ